MQPSDTATDEQQKRNNIRRILERAGISVDDERLSTLSRAVDANQAFADAIAKHTAGDRGPAVFHAPEPRADA